MLSELVGVGLGMVLLQSQGQSILTGSMPARQVQCRPVVGAGKNKNSAWELSRQSFLLASGANIGPEG